VPDVLHGEGAGGRVQLPVKILFVSVEKELHSLEEIRVELQARWIPATPAKVRECDLVCAYRRVGDRESEVIGVFELQAAYRDLEKMTHLVAGAVAPESRWPGDKQVPQASRRGLAYAELKNFA